MNNLVQRFETYLARQGLRLTDQRSLIAHTFFKTTGHVSAEELYRQVQKLTPGVGFATVYRTLKLLNEAGLAAGRNFRNGYVRFESAARTAHHDHLICTACGKIVEFKNDRIEQLQEEVAGAHNFAVADHTLEIYGTCADCRG